MKKLAAVQAVAVVANPAVVIDPTVASRGNNGKPLTHAPHGSKAAAVQTLLMKTHTPAQAAAVLAAYDENKKAPEYIAVRTQVTAFTGHKGSALQNNYALMGLERVAIGYAIKEAAPVSNAKAKAKAKAPVAETVTA